MGEAVGIKNTKDSIVYSTNFGEEQCSSDTYRLYIWLASDGGFRWPGDGWVSEDTVGQVTPNHVAAVSAVTLTPYKFSYKSNNKCPHLSI